MADVELSIGGRQYTLACRDGGEEHLRRIAAQVDEKAAEARRAVGSATEARQLLLAALLLADELDAKRAAAPGPSDDAALDGALAALAVRVEKLADGVEAALAPA